MSSGVIEATSPKIGSRQKGSRSIPSSMCQLKGFKGLKKLRFWCLDKPDVLKRLRKLKSSWEYKIQVEKERQLVNKAREQNYGGQTGYDPKTGARYKKKRYGWPWWIV